MQVENTKDSIPLRLKLGVLHFGLFALDARLPASATPTAVTPRSPFTKAITVIADVMITASAAKPRGGRGQRRRGTLAFGGGVGLEREARAYSPRQVGSRAWRRGQAIPQSGNEASRTPIAAISG